MKIKLTDCEIKARIEPLKKKTRLIGVGVLFILAAVLFLIALFGSGGDDTIPVALFFVAGFFITGFVLTIIGSHFKMKLKLFLSEHVVRDILCEFFEVEQFRHDSHIPRAVIKDASLIRGFDNCYGSDLVTGRYKGVNFMFSDIRLTIETTTVDSEGNTSTTESDVFKGTWFICNLTKDIPQKLTVRENSKKLLGKGFRNESKGIATENIEFNKRYEILCDKPHTAFYVLTPHFMEKITTANNQAGGRFFLCFHRNQVHMAVYNNRDFFDICRASTKNVEVLREKSRSEMRYLTGLVDILIGNEFLFGEEK